MPIPTTLPLSTFCPALLIVDFEVAARVPADIVVRFRDGGREVLRGEGRGECWFPVFQVQDRRVNIRRGIEPLLDTHENGTVNAPNGRMG
jgi:hypothetical protein